MQNIKTVAQTLLGETAHFGFCPPKIVFFGGPGGSPKFYFHWNPNFVRGPPSGVPEIFVLPWNHIIFVSKKHMKNIKTVAQTLLEETAHFGFCSPKIGLVRGVGGVPEFFSSSLESSYFCELGAHAKN